MSNSKHLGHNKHRLKQNHAERIFAKEWIKLQQPTSKWSDTCNLNWIFNSFDARGKQQPGHVSEAQMKVAATVVQWLGSPVGLGWLREVLQKIDKSDNDRNQ